MVYYYVGCEETMKIKLGRLLYGIGVILVICVLCFFGLKSFIVRVWMYPDEAKKYEVIGKDGRTLSMIFLPDRRTIIHYTDPSKLESEVVLTEMRGTFGTHYFGPLWRVEGPGVLLGIRWIPKGVEPVMMEIETLGKFRIGPGESTFPKVGKTTYSEILFSTDVIKFQSMWLEEVSANKEEIDGLLDLPGIKKNTQQDQ